MVAIIANIPETLVIRTRDQELVEVNSAFIRESDFLKNELRSNPNPGEIIASVRSDLLKNAITVIGMCDTSAPYVLARSDDDLRAYMRTIPHITEFIQSMSLFDWLGLHNVSSKLQMDRLRDLFDGSLLVHPNVEQIRAIVLGMQPLLMPARGRAAEAA
uniref:Histidine kinase n=1 Tax=Panagrellus redivivus TaxID=6233 RepID=A0A7E4W675_PANRE